MSKPAGLIATHRLLVSHVFERRASGVGGEPSRMYIKLHLWTDLESMWRGVGSGEGYIARHCPMAPPGKGLKMSDVHFAARHWDPEIVSHELMHAVHTATLSAVMARLGEGEEPSEDAHAEEELWCYRVGRWIRTTLDWLTDYEPPSPEDCEPPSTEADALYVALVNALDEVYGQRRDWTTRQIRKDVWLAAAAVARRLP